MIRLVLLWMLFAGLGRGAELDVVAMKSTPDQLFNSLKDHSPLMPEADCRALGLWECMATNKTRIEDISLRWVQLDQDAELEAILATEAKDEWTRMVFVFDKQVQWNLIGSFNCRRWQSMNTCVGVHQLLHSAPPFLAVHCDIGGSDTSIFTSYVYGLQNGRLKEVAEFTGQSESPYVKQKFRRQVVFSSEDRLVVETIDQGAARGPELRKCEVQRWDAKGFLFVASPEDQAKFCDAKTGRRVYIGAYPTTLPAYPSERLSP